MTAGAGITDLLELEEDNLFRVRTDRNASRIIRDLSRDVTGLVAAGEDHTELLGSARTWRARSERSSPRGAAPC